jgi:TRAP-type C4-dicarboxylate transport system permease small subunit
MARASSSLLAGAIRLHDGLLDLFGILIGAIAAFLAFGITADVLSRLVALGGIEWMLEASEYGLFYLTFLGAPWALREGAHVRVDLLLAHVSRSAARRLEIFADVLGLLASSVLAIWSVKVVAGSYAANSVIDKVLIFREWWLLAMLPASSALLCIEFSRRLARALRNDIEPEAKLDMF